MKKIFTKVSLLFILMAPLMPLHAQNLVQNGGAEVFDNVTFAPSQWTNIGHWTSVEATGYVDSVYEGSHMFFEGDDSLGILQQDVDVSSYAAHIDLTHLQLSFSCEVQSYQQGDPSDQTAYVIECLNAAKTQVLSSFSSDSIYSVNGWGFMGYDFNAPAGTRYVRIKLISIRNEGSDNGGYFDAVSLVPTIVTGVTTPSAYRASVSVTPNPATDKLFVSIKGQGITQIAIRNMQGAVIKTGQITGAENLDVSALAPGMYFLETKNDKTGTARVHFIKQ